MTRPSKIKNVPVPPAELVNRLRAQLKFQGAMLIKNEPITDALTKSYDSLRQSFEIKIAWRILTEGHAILMPRDGRTTSGRVVTRRVLRRGRKLNPKAIMIMNQEAINICAAELKNFAGDMDWDSYLTEEILLQCATDANADYDEAVTRLRNFMYENHGDDVGQVGHYD